MVEGNVDDAVTILDVKDNCVAPDFTPVADDTLSVFAPGHDSGQINGAHFEISCNRHRFFYNRRFENSGDDDLFSGFKKNSLTIVIGCANRFRQFI